MNDAAIEQAQAPPGVVELRRAVLTLDDQRQALRAAGDYTSLAYGGADLDVLLVDLHTLAKDIKRDIAALLIARHEQMGGKPKARPKVEIPHLGVVEVPGGNERTDWETDALLERVLLTCVIDDDGTIDDTLHPSVVVKRIAEVLPTVAAIGYWKVGKRDSATGLWSGLRGLGIDPADYCEEQPKERLAVIPKAPRTVPEGGF